MTSLPFPLSISPAFELLIKGHTSLMLLLRLLFLLLLFLPLLFPLLLLLLTQTNKQTGRDTDRQPTTRFNLVGYGQLMKRAQISVVNKS